MMFSSTLNLKNELVRREGVGWVHIQVSPEQEVGA